METDPTASSVRDTLA